MKKAQDYFSCMSHFYGAIVGVISFVILVAYTLIKNIDFSNMLGLYLFVISMICLYSASAFYHYLAKEHKYKQISRKIDHSMIYILIAGSYSPICLNYVQQPHGKYFLMIMFAIALVGIMLKFIWMNAPRVLYTMLYLIMGWAIVFDASSFSGVPKGLLVYIATGGIAYSIGAIIYIIKKPKMQKLSFHDVFHIFICIGTAVHLIGYSIYIL